MLIPYRWRCCYQFYLFHSLRLNNARVETINFNLWKIIRAYKILILLLANFLKTKSLIKWCEAAKIMGRWCTWFRMHLKTRHNLPGTGEPVLVTVGLWVLEISKVIKLMNIIFWIMLILFQVQLWKMIENYFVIVNKNARHVHGLCLLRKVCFLTINGAVSKRKNW